jgi:hypothetical protein
VARQAALKPDCGKQPLKSRLLSQSRHAISRYRRWQSSGPIRGSIIKGRDPGGQFFMRDLHATNK